MGPDGWDGSVDQVAPVFAGKSEFNRMPEVKDAERHPDAKWYSLVSSWNSASSSTAAPSDDACSDSDWDDASAHNVSISGVDDHLDDEVHDTSSPRIA